VKLFRIIVKKTVRKTDLLQISTEYYAKMHNFKKMQKMQKLVLKNAIMHAYMRALSKVSSYDLHSQCRS